MNGVTFNYVEVAEYISLLRDTPGRPPIWRLIPLPQQCLEVPQPAAPDVDVEMHPPSPGLSDAYDDMDEDFLIFEEEELTYLTDEGGVNLFNYLIANINEPVADNVHEWQYHDIQHLPEEELAKCDRLANTNWICLNNMVYLR